MAITSLCTTGFENIGSGTCSKVNPYGALSGLIITTSTFQIADATAFATKAAFTDGIKAGTVIPMMNMLDYEDMSVEPTYYESGLQVRYPTRQGSYRYKYSFNLPLASHKALQSLRNGNLRAFHVDENGIIYGTYDGTAVQGFKISMINPEKQTVMSSAADNVAFSHLTVDYADQKEWNEYGVTVQPTAYSVESLVPLTDVVVASAGTPTASEAIVEVYYDKGLSGVGAVAKEPILGLVLADFDVSLTGTASDCTDNGDGTYTFAGTLFADGTIDLKAPADITSEFDELYIKSTGAATITIA